MGEGVAGPAGLIAAAPLVARQYAPLSPAFTPSETPTQHRGFQLHHSVVVSTHSLVVYRTARFFP